MSKYKCYFAHPYESIGTSEEAQIIEELTLRRVEVVNPFDGEAELFTEYGNTDYYHPKPPSYKLGRSIWIKDLRQVFDCNMFLVYVPEGKRLTGGCGYEMCYAYQHHRYIQIISSSRHPAFAYVLTGSNRQFANIDDWKRHRRMVWD